MTTTVDTNNWDAVYAIHFSNLNLSIAKQWQAINMQFNETDESSGSALQYVLDATFAPWLLALGGDGKNVRFTCPIKSGSFSLQKSDGTVIKSYSFPTTAPLTEIAIEVGMEWVPDPSQTFFSIADKPTIDSLVTALDSQTTVPTALAQLFVHNNITLDSSAKVNSVNAGLEWAIVNTVINEEKNKEIQYFYILYARQLDNNQQVEAEFLYVYKFGQKWQANLKLMETDIETGGSAVTVTNILNSPIPDKDKVPALLFKELVNDWFNVNLKDFTQLFAQANITTTLDQNSNYQWLTPTATSYAVADASTFEDGIFGILTMTGGRAGLSNHQVSPDTIPDGCDAAFIISGPRFVQDMLLAGAMEIFGIDSTYFTITNAGMSVQNAKDISWGPFITTDTPDRTLDFSSSTKLDKSDLSDIRPILALSANATIKVMAKGIQWLITDGGTKYIIQVETKDLGVYKGTSMTIPASQFSMTLDNDKVTMKLVNFSYPYSDDYNVSVTYEESWTLGLKEVNKQNIFWFTQVSPPKMTTTVTQTKEALTREVIEAAIAGVLVLVTTIAPIASALRATAEVSEITNEANELQGVLMTLDDEAPEVENLIKKLGDTEQKAQTVTAEFQSQGRLTRIGNALGAPKWKAIAAVCGVTGLVAVTDIAVDKIISAFAGNDPQNHLPDFDAFTEFCIAPYSWSGVSDFDLVSANLANSLVIGLKAKQTS